MLNDLQKFRAQTLANMGGFSHRFIASQVYEKAYYRVTDKEMRSLQTFLYYNRNLVTQWRNGQTEESMAFAVSIVRPKKKKKRA